MVFCPLAPIINFLYVVLALLVRSDFSLCCMYVIGVKVLIDICHFSIVKGVSAKVLTVSVVEIIHSVRSLLSVGVLIIVVGFCILYSLLPGL